MPIIFSEFSNSIIIAHWIYIPDEELDFSKYISTLWLYIYAPKTTNMDVSESEEKLYTLPSLSLLFPNLRYLRIGVGSPDPGNYIGYLDKCFIGGITDIPETVCDIMIRNSYITDLSSVLLSGKSLKTISLINNKIPILFSVPIPYGVSRIFIESTTVGDPIIFPPTIISITCFRCSIPRLDGLDCADPNLYLSIQQCITPYDENILFMYGLDNKKNVEYITKVNAQQVYLDFGSIPSRIRISSDKELNNPIIMALHLASNYPRRMAEFIAITKVTTEFKFVNDEEDGDEVMGDNNNNYDFYEDIN